MFNLAKKKKFNYEDTLTNSLVDKQARAGEAGKGFALNYYKV